MSITASSVKQLREMTGAGMMACKEALKETNGNIEEAVDYLRKKGLAAAKKKQSRVAAEGSVTTLVQGGTGIAVEVNCETDFVANGDDFKNFAESVAKTVASVKPASNEELLNSKVDGGSNTVSEAANELTLKCGEKIDVRRVKVISQSQGTIGEYNHGGRIGVLVSLKVDGDATNPAVQELAKDLSMHIAAADPKFVNGSDIDEDFKKREAEIYKAQLIEQGKPENMLDKIVQGKLNKLATEVCLLEQKFIKDPDIAVKKLVESKAKEAGVGITIEEFVKVNLGEGIEKRQDNLADEVAKMTQK